MMWPLYEDDAQHRGVEEDTRWCGGPGRAYFNAFKDSWSRAHESSLLDQPPVGEQDNAVICDVKMRFRDEATRALEAAVVNARVFSHDEDHIDVVSVWDKMSQRANDTRVSTEESENIRLVWPSDRRNLESGNLCEAILVLERQDRRKEREAWSRLQEQSRNINHHLVQDLFFEPECSIVWEDARYAQNRPYTMYERQAFSSKPTEHFILCRHDEIKLLSPQMIEVPCLAQKISWKAVRKTLASQARQLLESVCTLDHNTALNFDDMNKCAASALELAHSRALRKRRPAEPVPRIMAPKATAKPDAQTEKSPRGPTHIKFDGIINFATPRQPVYAVASSIFKSIVKKNASLLLSCTVSETLSNDVSKLLRRANSTPRLNRQIDLHTCGGIQLLTLPPEIVKHDEDQLFGSYSALQTHAQRVAKSFSASPISLTSLSLEIASVWRHAPMHDMVRDVKRKQWTISNAYAVDLHERTLLDKERRARVADLAALRDVTDGERVRPSRGEHCAATDSLADVATQVSAKCRPPEVAAVQDRGSIDPSAAAAIRVCTTRDPVVFQTASTKSVTFKIQEDMSTEDLVTSFVCVERDEEVSSYASPLPLHRAPIPTQRKSSVGSQFASTIDQLARPAVWFLVRLRLLKVDSVSLLDALKTIHLDVFETVALQLHSKLADISANPSKLQSEDIIETCTAFRHAVWLHIIRMIVECGDSTPYAAPQISCRLLRSPIYLMAIGAKQTVALSNLHELMGGSPVTAAIQECRRHTGDSPIEEPPLKKFRPDVVPLQMLPIRLVCDVRLLEREELFETFSDLKISVIERELSPVIDLVIDEHNAVALLTKAHFSDEQTMRALTYELASSQLQYEKLWVIIDDVRNESALHFFYAALANFAINVQTFVCKGATEIGGIVRGIIDACAETALSQRRVLPKMWFARPFVLEEESQLERFLSSTRIMSAFAAQSVLHKLSIEDLVNKSLEEVTDLIDGSLTNKQVELLWRLLRTNHGVGKGEPICS